MSWANVIFQVGFWYKKTPDHVYYHERNWKLVGTEITIDNPSGFLDPFSLEDLLAWKIPYDLLPVALQKIIKRATSDTFELIWRDTPKEMKKLNPNDIEVVFIEVAAPIPQITPLNLM